VSSPIPIGLNLASIGVEAAWWLRAARRVEEAGLGSAWIWDHFVSRGRRTDPVLECWSMLAAAAVRTERIRLGSFVTNVMNRHPAVLARIVATTSELSGRRLELGIGAGGHPAEHHAYGMAFPAGSERAARLDEAITLLRLLLAGGPADFEGRYYRLEDAHAFPAPVPAPRIIVAGESPVGTRLAARRGDAWTCFASRFDELLPAFEAELAEAGRRRSDVSIVVGIEVEDLGRDLDELGASWHERGADELIVHEVRPEQLEAILAMAGD